MPPAPSSAEDKKINRLLRAVIAANAVALVLIIAGMVMGGLALMTKINPPKVKVEDKKDALPGPMIDIPDSIYNLGEKDRYLKAEMQLELNTEGLKDQEITDYVNKVKKLYPLMQDAIINHISGKVYHEVVTPEGKEQLKEELRVKINDLLRSGDTSMDVVKEVIFTSFAVQ